MENTRPARRSAREVIPAHAPRPRRVPWLVAILSTLIALGVRLAIDPYLGDQLPFVSFFVAVTVTAYFAQPGATVLAIVLGYLAASWFFIEPHNALTLETAQGRWGALTYFVVTGAVAVTSLIMARSRARVERAAAETAERQRQLEAEIADREQAQQALALQSHFASELLGVSAKSALMELIAARVHAVAGGGIVSVSEFDPDHGTLTVESVKGDEAELRRLAALLGRDPVGLALKVPVETRRAFPKGVLSRVPGGLYELTFGGLPPELCERAASELGLGDVFGMACSYEEDILATVSILSHERGPLSNQAAIESFVVQAGLALKRARSEEALRRAEERLRLAQELSLDAFTILDAVRDERGEIVDFRWTFVNPIAGQILRRDPQALVGQRLLELLPGNKEQSDLFERYVRVVETGEPHDCDLMYLSDGIEGWFRNMAVRSGDGVAVSFSEISERKRGEAALRDANERLREADRRKNEFLGVLSHELRNPLAAVSNSLYVLDQAEPGSERARRAQAVIGRQTRQLTRLVDDLLEVTRITRNKVHLNRQSVELNELVARAIEDFRPQFDAASVRLELDASGERVWIYGDPVRLGQVIGNLLHNASKFTGAGGWTRVSVRSDVGTCEAVLRVEDSGAGMTPELLGRLFEPFMQADHSLDRSKGGLGLGLALVKGLAELHGGTVSATSSGLGRGSAFVVRLPLAVAGADTAERVQAVRRGEPRRVLIVDDNFDAADSLQEMLAFEEHQVEVAYTGPEAIEKARNFRPDVVLCDIGLPGMDGYEVARAFRRDAELGRVFLAALSGYALPDDLRRAREAGFEHHIAKPPSLEELRTLLESLGDPRNPAATAANA